MALLDKIADGECITGGVTGSKALVGHVEKGEEGLLLYNIGDFLPLFRSRVDTGRVMRAGVEKNDRFLRDVLKSRRQSTYIMPVCIY